MIWFISDTHFNHDREFIWGPRGFKNCIDSNNTIIKNWNSCIGHNDDVYMLGDFFLGKDENFIRITLMNLNGRIHLIRGNHDTNAKIHIYRNYPNVVEIVWATQIEYNGRLFYLSHYPTLTADLNSNPDRCVFGIFGHTHSKEKFYEGRPYMYNVAVDAHDNKPVSIDQVYEDIQAEIKKCISFLV